MATMGLIIGVIGVAHGTIGKFSWFLIVVSTLIIFISIDTIKRMAPNNMGSKNQLQGKTSMLLLILWLGAVIAVMFIRLNL